MASDILRHDLRPFALVLAVAQKRCHNLEGCVEEDEMMASCETTAAGFKGPMVISQRRLLV